MSRKIWGLLHCSVFALMPFVADAAGTYFNYNGTVQRNYGGPHSGVLSNYGNVNYGNMGNNVNYNNSYKVPNYAVPVVNTPAENNVPYVNSNTTNTKPAVTQNVNNVQPSYNVGNESDTGGFRLNAGFSHEFAGWKFDMKTAASKLHFDNISWNVFNAGAVYDFEFGKTKLRVQGGAEYGVQSGDSTMVDDDITGGGYFLQDWNVDLDGDGMADQVWSQHGHALSIGTSNGGSRMGFYAGIGLVDAWNIGGLKIMPSVGYRYFKYKLETKNNYGMSLDSADGATNYCQSLNGETQCLPFLVFVDDTNSPLLGTIDGVDLDGDGYIDTFSYISVPSGTMYVETENTYFYHQDGVSHSYEVEWAGPYLALDLEYKIFARDTVSARFEFGLPSYTATADQPYRPDWQHPKSLEDIASIGDAYHVGLGAQWMHALSDSIWLTVGATLDMYSVNKADASSYLSPDYYNSLYYVPAANTNVALANEYGSTEYWNWTAVSGRDLQEDQAVFESNLGVMSAIEQLKADGWKQTVKEEIESFYKSLGIHVGIQAKF